MTQYLGKYRGTVVDPRDPDKLGRVKVRVPIVHEDLDEAQLPWAMPCSPYAGQDVGFFMIPPGGANVWVEFEQGEVDLPIWTGCFWESGQLPENAQVDEPEKVQVFRVEGITCTWSNHGNNKGVTLEVQDPVVQNPLKLVFNAEGIELNNNNATVIRIKSDEIQIDNRGSSTLVLTTSDITLTEQSTMVKLSASSTEIRSSPATAKFDAASGIELKHGGASIAMAVASVNVNNGALEVV
jgi:uncharacterized protein involved in type VI secretion and phage assembly